MCQYDQNAPSVGTLLPIVNATNAALDGVLSVTGISSFTVTTAATNNGSVVSMTGNDGTPNRVYSMTYDQNILSGGAFTLINGSDSITFINRSSLITSAAALATYLAQTYPLQFVISDSTMHKITALNTILGNGPTLYGQAMLESTENYGANILLDGVVTVSGFVTLTITTAATNVSGNVSFVANDGTSGQTYALQYVSSILGAGTFILTCSGKSVTFINMSGITISSASALATYLSTTYPVNAIISNTTNNKVWNQQQVLSSAPSITSMATLVNIENLLGGSSSDIISRIGAPSLGSVVADVGGSSTTSVESALNALSMQLFNNTITGASLSSQASSLTTALDNTLNSLPNGGTYATVSVAATSDGSGGVNITINAGLGSGNGTYNLSSASISGVIVNGGSFTLSYSSYSIVLYNKLGASIATQAAAISYLRSMYPVGAKIAVSTADKVTGLNTMIGGTGTSTKARLGIIGSTLINTPAFNNNVLFASNSFATTNDLNTQLSTFIALFNPANWATGGRTHITFTFSSGGPNTLADILNAASATL